MAKNKVFVGGLPYGITDEEIKAHFEKEIGAVTEWFLVRDKETQQSKGCGFVTFENAEDAQSCIEKCNKSQIQNRTINVNWATAKPTDRAGDGGGRGGRGRGRGNFRGGRGGGGWGGYGGDQGGYGGGGQNFNQQGGYHGGWQPGGGGFSGQGGGVPYGCDQQYGGQFGGYGVQQGGFVGPQGGGGPTPSFGQPSGGSSIGGYVQQPAAVSVPCYGQQPGGVFGGPNINPAPSYTAYVAQPVAQPVASPAPPAYILPPPSANTGGYSGAYGQQPAVAGVQSYGSQPANTYVQPSQQPMSGYVQPSQQQPPAVAGYNQTGVYGGFQ